MISRTKEQTQTSGNVRDFSGIYGLKEEDYQVVWVFFNRRISYTTFHIDFRANHGSFVRNFTYMRNGFVTLNL